MKKWFSIMLCIAMVLTMVPAALAEEAAPEQQTAPVIPVAGRLLDFETEDAVKAATGNTNKNWTVSYTNDHAATGNGAVEFSSETDVHWGNQIWLNLGNGLGDSDAAYATYIGFHIQAAKGAANNTKRGNDFLMQDIQITADGAWYTLVGGSTYYCLADGTNQWVQDTTDFSALMLESGFSGYVFIPIASFEAGGEALDPAKVFSKKNATFLVYHVHAAGGDYGSIYMDTVCYSTAPALGGALRNFETEDEVKAATGNSSKSWTISYSNEHVGTGTGSLQVSAETDVHWGNQVWIDLGSKLGQTDIVNAGFIGFHIQAAKGAANGSRRPDAFLLQDIQITAEGAWYTFTGGASYYCLADGSNQWTSDTLDGNTLMLDSEFSGYVYLPFSGFQAGGETMNPAEAFSKDGSTYFVFHVNAAGGEYGSFWLDNIAYQQGFVMPEAGEKVEEILYEDIDAVSYAVDQAAIKAVNGEGALPAAQEAVLLVDFEELDADKYYPIYAADRTQKEFSKLHTGTGMYAMKVYSGKERNWDGAVNYMVMGDGIANEGTPAADAKWFGYHIKTPNVPNFQIQDVQLTAASQWYTLKGGADYYYLEDGASQWQKGETKGSSTFLPANWSGFVAFRVEDFISDSKTLVFGELFGSNRRAICQVHYNLMGGPHGSVFVDSYFVLTDELDPAAATLTQNGEYLAGLTAAPVNDVLKTVAASEKILKIAGERIYARENTVAGFKALLTAEGCEIAVTKEGEAASDDEALAQGMVVTVSKDGAAIAAYYVADVAKTPDPSVVFALTLKEGDEKLGGVAIDEHGISCQNLKADELIADKFNVPFGTVAHVFKDGVMMDGATPVEEGMTLRCYDECEPELYFELVFANVGVIDFTNGYALQLAEGAAAAIDGGVITVPAGTTVEDLCAMLIYVGAEDMGLVLDADEFPMDDDEVIEAGWILLIVDDMFDELARWTIQ
ncbi:MAG: hypothetical protein E7324_00540 [Clostridiales bacterium]|nr:hypothetical protein [Clostridiales bacterium]